MVLKRADKYVWRMSDLDVKKPRKYKVVAKEWDESLHPRDEQGRFSSVGGTGWSDTKLNTGPLRQVLPKSPREILAQRQAEYDAAQERYNNSHSNLNSHESADERQARIDRYRESRDIAEARLREAENAIPDPTPDELQDRILQSHIDEQVELEYMRQNRGDRTGADRYQSENLRHIQEQRQALQAQYDTVVSDMSLDDLERQMNDAEDRLNDVAAEIREEGIRNVSDDPRYIQAERHYINANDRYAEREESERRDSEYTSSDDEESEDDYYDEDTSDISAMAEHIYNRVPGVSASINSVDNNGSYITVGMSLHDDDGNRIGTMNRSFYPESGRVHHDLFEVDSSKQGEGIAAKMNAAAEEGYLEAGYTEIELNADITVGKYAWAKQGYDVSPTSRPYAMARWGHEVERQLAPYGGEAIADGEAMIRNAEHSWDIAALDYKGEVFTTEVDGKEVEGHLGKIIMLNGPSWDGIKDLTPGSPSRAVGDAYFKQKGVK